MDDKEMEKMLEQYKNSVPVNEELKRDLRKKYLPPKRRTGFIKRFSIVAGLTAAVLVITFALQGRFYNMIPDNKLIQKVNAETLKINGYSSVIELGIGNSIDVSEYNGTLYVPLFGDGLFKYNSEGFKRIYDKEVRSVRVSEDGKKLLLGLSEGIGILDIETGKTDYILKPEDGNTYLENPSWAGNTDKIIYVSKVIAPGETHGYEVKESDIYIYDLKTGQKAKVANGEYPSVVKENESILFERDGKIIYKNLKENSEIQIDEGRFPSASPDGSLAAYVKTESSVKKINEMASVEESVNNIYIADINAVSSKKKVTTNYTNRYISEEEWLKSIGKPTIPNVLTYSGAYDYFNPVWSSDSKSIYALKNANQNMRVIKIDLSTEKNKIEETVKSYLQALITRDDDFARGLLSYQPDMPLTISNPHQSGYRIISSGKENDKNYVDAESYLSTYGQAYFRIEKKRFYLSESGSGYLIDKISDLESIDVYERNNIVYMESSSKGKSEMMKTSELSGKFGLSNSPRFTSIAYDTKNNKLFFSASDTKKVIIGEYDVSSHTFSQKSDLSDSTGLADLAVSQINTSADSKFISVDYFNGLGTNPGVIVINTSNNQAVDIKSLIKDTRIDGMNTLCWDGNILLYRVTSYGESTTFRYTPKE